MLTGACHTVFRLAPLSVNSRYFKLLNNIQSHFVTSCRQLSSKETDWKGSEDNTETPIDNQTTDLVEANAKEVLEKAFPKYFNEDGGFVNRISYVDFIDESLARFKELGLERNLDAYKELLRIFPPGKYHPKSFQDVDFFFATPQQMAANRVLDAMEMARLRPDKDFERLVMQAFGRTSSVWYKIGRMNYWTMKSRNIDANPLPETIPEQPQMLAKIALKRMASDHRTELVHAKTAGLQNSVDKTWITFCQSPIQKEIIANLSEDSMLYIENSGLTYVDRGALTYYTLKFYVDDETRARKNAVPEPDWNYNTVKMQFFGKPIKEKMEQMIDQYYDGEAYILAVGITGTSSHDSILSWLKLLQLSNRKLEKMSVLFRLERPTYEVIESTNEHKSDDSKQKAAK